MRNTTINILVFSTAVLLMSCMPRTSAGKPAEMARAGDSSSSAKTLVLRASRLLDVRAGKYLSPAVVVVEGARILSVNPKSIPKDAREIRLDGMTLVPGLIDMHTHLTFDITDGEWLRSESRVHVGHHAIRGVRNAWSTLLAGFTTVRDMSSLYFSDVALARAIEGGLVPGPRIVPCGHAIGITGGHCDWAGYAPGFFELDWRNGVADGPDELIKAIRYQVKHGAEVIKICATAGFISFEKTSGAQQMSKQELAAAVEEAHRHGLKVAAHATGEEGAVAAVEAGVDSIEHADCITERSATAIMRRGAYLVPTALAIVAPPPKGLPPSKKKMWIEAQKSSVEGLRLAIRKGVKIAFGTDATVFPHGQNAKELALLVKYGMSPIEVLRSATLNAADLLGVADRGEIRSGLFADIVGVKGDPVKNVQILENVDFVMKGGVVYKNGGKPVCQDPSSN